jgi:hypothetical protein
MKTKLLLIIIVATSFALNVYSQTYIIQVKPMGNKLWGYAGLDGKMIIPAQYEKCYKFSPGGYATVYDKKNRQYQFINLKGEKLETEITSFKIQDGFGFDVDGFVNGLVAVKVGEKWGFLNSQGKLAIPAKYDNVTEFSSGYATANIDGSYVVLNTKGEETKVDVSGVMDVKPFTENLAPYRAADKNFGFIGPDGKEAIPAKFESVGYFSDGLAWAKADAKQLGYINTKGEWIIEPKFAAGKEFDTSTGLARVKTHDGKWAYVDKKGEMLYVNDTEVWGDFRNGLADGKKEDKRGFYNNKGEWVIQPKFEGVRDFKNGYAAAKLGGKWGVIDKTGKWVIQPAFDGIKDVESVK